MALRTIIAIATFLLPQLTSGQQKVDPSPQPLLDEGMGYEHVERLIHVLEQVRSHHPDRNKFLIRGWTP